MLRNLVVALGWSAIALAQQTPGQPGQNGNPNAPPGTTPRYRPSPDNTGTPADSPRSASAVSDTISGRVVLSDAAEPGEGVRVQRVCGLAVVSESYTDSRGRFTVQRAATRGVSGDATSQSSTAVWGCEIRASLSEYQTATVTLTNRRAIDGSDIGTIVLRRAGSPQGMTVSATTLLAPKKARKAYDKGLDAVHRAQPDQAQKAFAEAVRVYPRFAAAWLELGKVYEQRDHLSQARIAYGKAVAADADFVLPYERLYLMDIRESKWQEAADASSKVLRLDPYEFPRAYYFNAISNLELRNLDAAERSAREAAKLEGDKAEPRANYVLGVVLWRKGDLDGAADRLRTFLAGSIGGPERVAAERMLADIAKQVEKGREQSAR